MIKTGVRVITLMELHVNPVQMEHTNQAPTKIQAARHVLIHVAHATIRRENVHHALFRVIHYLHRVHVL